MSTSTGIRRIKNNCNHICDLPECIISHILSRLPMLDAVRTSILAKDWEHKWRSMYKIELDDYKPKNRSTKRTFVNFVERTLLLSHGFRSFHLSCGKKYDSSDIETWISTALARDLHCLDIYYREAGIVLPPNLVKFNSLRELELNIPCTFKVLAKICFPHLITLRLMQVEILNELPNSDTVMFDFPVLETLELIKCKWLNVKCAEIYAPKRTTFKYEASTGGAGGNNYLIKITEDGLVKLESCFSFSGYIVLSGGQEVARAFLENNWVITDPFLLEKEGLQIRKQLEGLLSLNDLRLCGAVAKAIALSKPGLPLPMYYKMQRLYLQGFGNAEALVKLLHAAPFLKILDMGMANWNDYDYDAEQYVPRCVVSHLEDVKLRGFAGTTAQFKLAKFLLKNALQLKKIGFSETYYHHMTRNDIQKELSRYPKASACLSISITMHCIKHD